MSDEIKAPTPSEVITRTAAKAFDVTDALGRTITLKKPSPLANLDFSKAVGAGGDINRLYLLEVLHLKFIAAIDGMPVITPGSDAEVRALYSQLGDEGNAAAQSGVYEHFLQDGDAEKDAATKNS